MTLRASRFGAVADASTDDGPALRAAFAAAQEAGPGTTLVLEPGTYLVRTGENGVALPLTKGRGVTIDAEGATLVVGEPALGGVRLTDCEDVTLRGLVVDFDPVPFGQGRIESIDEAVGTFVVAFDDRFLLPDSPAFFFDHDVLHPSQFGSFYDPATRELKAAHRDHVFVRGMTPAGDGRWTVAAVDERRALRELHGVPEEDLPAGGFDVLAGIEPGDLFLFAARHTGCGVTALRSAAVRVERTVVHAAASHAYLAEQCGDVTLSSVAVRHVPDSDRLITTDGDGFHYKDGRGSPVVEDSWFEGMLDDGFNDNATPFVVTAAVDGALTLRGTAPLVAGDRLLLQSPRTGRVVLRSVVEQLTAGPGPQELVVRLVDDVPEVATGQHHFSADVAVNLSASGNGYRVLRNTYRSHRGIAIRPRSGDGVIEGNTVDGTGSHAVLVCNDPSWPEGPVPHDVVVRGNTFRRTGLTNLTEAVRVIGSRIGDVPAEVPVVERVEIVDNTISDCAGAGIYVGGCRDVLLTGNTVERVVGRPVAVEACEDVRGVS